MRIDAHQHFWDLGNEFTHWPTSDLKAIYRNFLPENLRNHLKEHKIDKTVLVQAAPNIEETDFLLELTEKNDFIGGVVGWFDMDNERFLEEFANYSKHPKLVGIRPMLQGLADDRWILRPEVKRSIQILIDHDFPIDILIYPKHLPHIVELLEEFPTLRAVIDHCAKPNIKDRQWDEWAKGMEKISQFDSVMCKLSGLVTEADHQTWNLEDFRPYIENIFNCFGPKRVMFGSDWPVCLLAASYDEVMEILQKNIPANITDQEKELLFGGNAKKFYKL
ncbi:amidohydrolase family protein [Bacillus niameyensis]|uniref:amidohydrolase family protein n=1 Tax=Bacillus niameyensis TaxID=1522308 RepID=UPI0007860841|nr:amidohydrolase family protein [Bacillus niameyensis]